MKVSVWQYHTRSLPWSWLTEEDDWGLELPPKRKVFRSHYHSQFQWVRGESGSLGLVWWHAVQGRSSKRWVALRCHVFLPLCVLKMVHIILYLSFSSHRSIDDMGLQSYMIWPGVFHRDTSSQASFDSCAAHAISKKSAPTHETPAWFEKCSPCLRNAGKKDPTVATAVNCF